MNGKVNGAVETCMGEDSFVISKRFKSYLNFSHPLIAKSFDPKECAWAYGMNIFDLEAWRNTNISLTYYHWLEEVSSIINIIDFSNFFFFTYKRFQSFMLLFLMAISGNLNSRQLERLKQSNLQILTF